MYDVTLEVQTVTCAAINGTFQVGFRLNNTRPIQVSATAMGSQNSLQAALEEISYIRNVTVSLDPPATTVCSPGGSTARVTFITGTLQRACFLSCPCWGYATLEYRVAFWA